MGDSTKLFTVFVGHLSMDTTKKDLWDLFRECGDVHETYTVQQSKEMCFKYGFVRFKDTDSARKAVRELNGWKLKGNRIVVEAAKRDASGDEVVLPRSGPSTPVAVERSVPRRSHSETNADHMTGLKNLSRLKDACAVVNFDLDTHSKSGQRVDVDKLMKDINEETCSRPATQISKVYGVDCSVEIATAQLHKCRCSKSCTKDKRADDFLKSLKVIMKNINTYLENVSAKTHPVQESENSDCECHPTSTKENPAETLSKGTSHELYKPTAMIKESGLTNYHYNKAVVTTGSEESCSEELISSFNSSLSFDSSFSSSFDSSGTGFKPVSSEFTQSSTVVGVANGNISRALFTHSPEEVDLRNSSLTSKDFNFNPRTAGEGLLQSEKNVEQILSVLGRGRRLRTSYQ